ncbi:MAG: hypothetical protein IJ225_05865 [Solobacterium sp.]|nr:hypothetical protein [Solobacterium sp.]
MRFYEEINKVQHMDEKELRKLSRKDLLELLLDVTKENERLKKRIKAYEEALEDKTIRLEESGNIAEAALKLNEVFEAAQEAADQYVANVKRLYGDPYGRQ